MRPFRACGQLLPAILTVSLLVSCDKKPHENEKPTLPPGESISIEAKLNRNVMYLGEDARLTITAIHHEDTTVDFPAQMEPLDELIVVDSGRTGPERLSQGAIEESVWFDITTNTPGDYSIPGITITYANSEGEREYVTGKMNLKFVRTVEDISEIKALRDIKPPRHIQKSYFRLFVFLGAVLGGLTLAYIVRRIISRKRKTRRDQKKPVPPNIQALEELKRIEDMKLLEEKRPGEFIVMISAAVRRYIERRFSVPAEEMTTDEFLRRSEKGYYLTDECRIMIREFLQRCDAVKFAAHLPTDEECETILEKAVEFIAKSY